MGRMGAMASGLAGGMAAEGLRRVASGQRPELRDLMLTPGNITRIADQLARMRGAAMKVGQLISMDTGDLLPPELAAIMARLRAEADHMPPRQLRQVLLTNWGTDWQRPFARFDVRPIAAASIGQVHRATLKDGRSVAIKVQYPGVRRSIDSDVTNVAALIRMSGLIPDGLDIAPLLDEARKQLHEEADYEREGRQLARFGNLLADDFDYVVPDLLTELTTPDILTMSFAHGVAVERMTGAPQETRDRIVRLLLDLLFREVFGWRLVQTDPNFANYRYDPETGRVVLLDFGAARDFAPPLVEGYRALLAAGIAGDRAALEEAALGLSFFAPDTAPYHKAAVVEMMDIAFEALRLDAPFDFASSDVVMRLRDRGMEMSQDRTFLHMPPVDVFYLQRKFAGLYLLARTLSARVNVRALAERWL